jgi:recombination protein RecA
VGSNKTRRLEMTVTTIQHRWGLKALQRLETPPSAAAPHIPTGFPPLDNTIGIGGIPRGRITEVLGAPTSGMATLALKIIARAQSDGDTVAYVDMGATFDPDYAARCGVNLDRVLLVRPPGGKEAVEIVHALIARGGAGALVLDAVPHLLAEPPAQRMIASILRRLTGVLAGSACAPIFLTPLHFGDAASTHNYPSGFDLPHHAAVRLLIEKERWLQKRRDIVGYQAKVSVLKNVFGPSGKNVSIEINFHGVVLGNGT